MPHTVFFPGIFDPITNGHLNLIQRASQLFSAVIVGVAADTSSKTPLFDTSERQTLLEMALAPYKNVRVIAYRGLTVTAAREQGATALLRGLRSNADFSYEQPLAMMNRSLAPIETLFLVTDPSYQHISSTLVRQIAQLGGDVSGLVPKVAAEALLHKVG